MRRGRARVAGTIAMNDTLLPGLEPKRSEGRDAFLQAGIPTTRDEAWKYTSLRSLQDATFGENSGIVSVSDVDRLAIPNLESYRIVVVDGRVRPDLSADFVGFQVLEGVQGRVGELIKFDLHPFAALNTATFSNIVRISVGRGQRLDRPVQVIHITTGSSTGWSYAAPRLLIEVEDGAELSLVESYGTVGVGASLTNAVTEVHLGANAGLEHVKVQRESKTATHIANTEVKQKPDSRYNGFNVNYGGGLTRNDANVFLDGSNIRCRMDGVIVLGGDQHCDNHTRLDHAFPHCDSFEVYKHVLRDHSRAVFNGQIYVHQDAQKTDAKQTNQTLLLSEHASIDSKPQLEIYADDVKCTHGATVGNLDDEPLFYMRSRGIPESQAQGLLVYAFAAEVLEKIEMAPVRVALEQLLFEQLQGGG